MQLCRHWITENDYLEEDYNSVFLQKFTKILEIRNDLHDVFKDKFFVSALIRYPSNGWSPNLDLFKFFNPEIISSIQNRKCFFIFNAGPEGFSPIYENWFYILHKQCQKHNINPKQIIYVSSNLQDDENIRKFPSKNKINVITFPVFQDQFQYEKYTSLDNLLKETEEETRKTYNGKFFSSLSRSNRRYRTIATFLLCQSNFKEKALISHDSFDSSWLFDLPISRLGYNNDDLKNWINTLPLKIDYLDFDTNWIGREYKHIHHQTIFQIVNETSVNDYSETSMFYSEKTFRPINCFQPFVIYGQKKCNHFLEKIGFKLYNDWFDYEFDNEPDNVLRYKKLLLSVQDVCNHLSSLDRNKQIEWKFKNKDILLHNIKVLHDYDIVKEKIHLLIDNLKNNYFNLK